jgi:hypothetical protein
MVNQSSLGKVAFLLVALVALCIAGVYVWYTWPVEVNGPVKEFAELMTEPTPPELLMQQLGGMPGKKEADKKGEEKKKPLRDQVKAVALLAELPALWGNEFTDEQLNEMLAGAALRDDTLVVMSVTPFEGAFRLKTRGEVTTPLVMTADGPVVYVLRDPDVVVENEGGRVRPLRLVGDNKPKAVVLNAEEALVQRAALWLSRSDPQLQRVLPPEIVPPERAFTEAEVAVFWADQAIRRKGVNVVKVEKLGGNEWKLVTKGRFRLGPARVRNKDGGVDEPYLSVLNPDIIVKVHGGKLVPARLD